jgi:hypothetical protein
MINRKRAGPSLDEINYMKSLTFWNKGNSSLLPEVMSELQQTFSSNVT